MSQQSRGGPNRVMGVFLELADSIPPVSPALHEFFQSLHEKLDQVSTSAPNKIADLVEGKNRHLLMEWKEVTSQRSQDDESGQKVGGLLTQSTAHMSAGRTRRNGSSAHAHSPSPTS